MSITQGLSDNLNSHIENKKEMSSVVYELCKLWKTVLSLGGLFNGQKGTHITMEML